MALLLARAGWTVLAGSLRRAEGFIAILAIWANQFPEIVYYSVIGYRLPGPLVPFRRTRRDITDLGLVHTVAIEKSQIESCNMVSNSSGDFLV